MNEELYVYRIYEACDESEKSYTYGFFDSEVNRKLIDSGYVFAENRDEFKSIIKETYPNINFGRKKNAPIGFQYCSVVYHNKYDKSKSQILSYKCDYCNKEVFNDIFSTPYNLYQTYHYIGIGKKTDNKYYYCSQECKDKHCEVLKQEEQNKNGNNYVDEFITKESFSNYNDGFIYKISKKSTGEFYIGQTRYVPIFRWGQHLRTERFDIKNICDYLFEVIEICSIDKLNERESHYINLYKNDPLNLNIMIPKDKEQLKLDMEVSS